MSTKQLFILVEGSDVDPFFYSRLLRPVCESAQIPCDVVRGDIVSGNGGKQTLLELHQYLASTGSLVQQIGTTRKWCLFCLDKDIDDLTGKLVSSRHIVYTPFYCVENALFMYGEVVTAAAAASSLDPEEIRARIPSCDEWRRRKTEHWKEFLVLSLLSNRLRVNCACHYGRRTSPLNAPADGPTDMQRADTIRQELRTRARLPLQTFDRKLGAVRRYVECRYRKNLHDTLFNGKWYIEFLRREIHLVSEGRRRNNPPTSALVGALNLSIDFSGPWTEHFRQPLRDLISHEPNEAAEE